MSIDGRTVGVALGIDLGIGLASFTIFSILRIIKSTRRYYDPRTYYANVGSSAAATAAPNPGAAAADPTSSGGTARTPSLLVSNLNPNPLDPAAHPGMPLPGAPLPPVLPRTLLTWIKPLLHLSEARVIAAVGLDVAMLLRFIRFALKLLLCLMVWCIGVVLPINFCLGTNLAEKTELSQQLANTTAAIAASPSPPATAAAAKEDNFLNTIFPIIPGINSSSLSTSSSSLSSSSNSSRAGKVQLGPGQDVTSLAASIEAGVYVASDLDRFSMANIPSESPLLWVHLASVYVVTAITLKLLWSATSSALELYLRHLSSSSMNLDSASHTALLSDIPGLPRNTLLDKVLHAWLFRLLPPGVRARLRAAWEQIDTLKPARQAVLKTTTAVRWRRTAGAAKTPAAVAAAAGGVNGSKDRQERQHQENRSSDGGSSGDDQDANTLATANGTAAAPAGSAAPAAADSSKPVNAVSIYIPAHPSTPDNDSSAAEQDQQAAAATTNGVPLLKPADKGATSSSSGLRQRNTRIASSSTHSLQEQHQDNGGLLLPDDDSALSGAVRVQAGARAFGVGGFGVFSGEWRRATAHLSDGTSLKEFVLREFQDVYGPENIVAAHIVNYSPKVASLVQQYNTTRTALEDMLDSYSEQLAAAAAAAAGGGGAGSAGHLLQRQRRPGLKPVPIRMLPLPAIKKNNHHNEPKGPPNTSTTNGNDSNDSRDSISNGSSQPALATITAADSPVPLPAAAHAGSHASATSPQVPADASVTADDLQHDSRSCWQPCSCFRSSSSTTDATRSSNAGVTTSNSNKQGSSSAAAASSKQSNSSSSRDRSSNVEEEGGSKGVWQLCFRRAARHDALEVLLAQLQQLRCELEAAQAEAAADPLPAAFVTFRTRTTLTAAVSCHHVAEAGVWGLTAAPPPDSLIWAKLGLRYWELGLRRGAVYTTLTLLAFFYVIPVAVVQGLLQLDRLQTLPVIGTLVSLPVVHSLLVGVLPGLALRIFVLLLPVILYALNRRAGAVGVAELDGSVATHFFTLQVIIVFFASFITGSLVNQLSVLFTNGVGPVLERLGTGAPQTANFFILYIIFTAFIGRSWGLLRPWGLLMTSIRTAAARNKGSSGRRRAVVVGTYRMFGPSVPEHSIILLLGLVFSVIAPLVLAAALVFFCMALMVESYNWVWVYRRPYEGGGRLWKQLFRHVFIALYIFQLVMVALLIVKKFLWVPLLLPALLVTLLVHHIGTRLLQRSWDVLAVRAAHELDLADRQEAMDALRQGGCAVGDSQQQQQQLEGQLGAQQLGAQQGGLAERAAASAGDSGRAVDADAAAKAFCDSQAKAWSEMYRPPAVQLLAVAGQVQEGLQGKVAAMQARLAAHNAAAAAEAAMKDRTPRPEV